MTHRPPTPPGDRPPAPRVAALTAVMEVQNLSNELYNPQNKDRFSLAVKHLVLPAGGFVSVVGGTGCGKTTLLTLLGLLRQPARPDGRPAVTKFVVHDITGPVDVAATWARGQRPVAELRRQLIGFCLQSGELLPTLTAYENVEMPLRLNGWSAAHTRDRVRELLTGLSTKDAELWGKRDSLPRNLSGGQQQRVAIARAVAHQPRVLFLDEPTGSLNEEMARKAVDLLSKLSAETGSTVVMITHDRGLAQEFGHYLVEMGPPGDERLRELMKMRLVAHPPTPPGHPDGAHQIGTILQFRRRADSGAWLPTDACWTPLHEAAQVPAALAVVAPEPPDSIPLVLDPDPPANVPLSRATAAPNGPALMPDHDPADHDYPGAD